MQRYLDNAAETARLLLLDRERDKVRDKVRQRERQREIERESVCVCVWFSWSDISSLPLNILLYNYFKEKFHIYPTPTYFSAEMSFPPIF